MIEEIERFKKRIDRTAVVMTGLIGYVINKIFDWNAPANFENPKRFAGEVAAYASFTLLMVLFDMFLASLPNKYRRFRRYLIGNKYVEGVWFELVLDERRAPYYIGYTFIRIEEGDYKLAGCGFMLMDRESDFWKSDNVNFRPDGEMEAIYKLTSARTGVGEIYNYLRYGFTISADAAIPRSYKGFYTYALDNKNYYVEGRIISKKSIINDINEFGKDDFDFTYKLYKELFKKENVVKDNIISISV